jgi:C4-type Zn-finger protein
LSPDHEPVTFLGSDRAECPVCLEHSLGISPVTITVHGDPSAAARIAYSAICSSCGFIVEQDRRVELSELIAAFVRLDVRHRSYGEALN